tara:strand:- start:2545 stop:3222 length:678 start_codon:yes stop_codon:yes gene_type:complete
MIASAIMGGVQGLVGIIGASVGTRARRREEKEAQLAMQQSRRAFEDFEFQNPFANMENTFEDLKVNTQAADFAAQQQQQATANILQGLQGAAGGSGVAALAQTLAQQQTRAAQQASASIAQQERQNQILAAQGAAKLQQLEGSADLKIQEAEQQRTATILGMDQQRLAAAQQARKEATAALGESIGSFVGGAGTIAAAGLTGGATGPGAFGENLREIMKVTGPKV